MTSTIKVDTIQNSAGTTGLTIDSSGRVSRGVVPSWRIGLTSNQSVTVSNTVVDVLWDRTSAYNTFLDGGCTLSSGVVTVPVDGVYNINFNVRFDNIGSGYIISRIVINNDTTDMSETYNIDGSPPSNYQTLSASDVFKLSANDEVKITAYSFTDSSWSIVSNSSFSGVLIG